MERLSPGPGKNPMSFTTGGKSSSSFSVVSEGSTSSKDFVGSETTLVSSTSSSTLQFIGTPHILVSIVSAELRIFEVGSECSVIPEHDSNLLDEEACDTGL